MNRVRRRRVEDRERLRTGHGKSPIHPLSELKLADDSFTVANPVVVPDR